MLNVTSCVENVAVIPSKYLPSISSRSLTHAPYLLFVHFDVHLHIREIFLFFLSDTAQMSRLPSPQPFWFAMASVRIRVQERLDIRWEYSILCMHNPTTHYQRVLIKGMQGWVIREFVMGSLLSSSMIQYLQKYIPYSLDQMPRLLFISSLEFVRCLFESGDY